MVAIGYGKADKDKVGKELSDKPLKGPGTDVKVSAMIGGISNRTTKPSAKKGARRKG